MKVAVRSLNELEPDFVLAPERHVLLARTSAGVPLGELVVERRERIDPASSGAPLVLDTTHAKDGIFDVCGALRQAAGDKSAKSAKKRARAGDVVISRLRPYLRQVAFVHPSALRLGSSRPLALSTEFYVLAPRDGKDDLAFLVPFLLSAEVQAALAAAQEGGHHPRVPLASLLGLRLPTSIVRARARTSAAVRAALAAAYAATRRLETVLNEAP